jgi:hypothetical protein
MGKLENIFGRIKPNRKEKREMDDFFKLQLLTAAYLRGKIPLGEYQRRADGLEKLDFRLLHSKLGPPLRR